ncbi:metallophosphoesterase [Nitrobacter sp. Nb-311A]|uniref:metallophosphoesterase family protein n=1 Tax=unclassified Nitrobacter TaxID=2620411 RepID=UPI0000686005|nr:MULTISPECIES: metallophosphoesterase [unclassified Nitrobacter]EAQ36606.1 metallophosphoesterase [Nitrobacter sp. Nb-311A]MCV0385984.1 metallophosphoesterase [Nitrobacter sp.]
MTALTLAHLSDPHLGPLPPLRLHQLAGKRAIGYLNWKRGRHAIHRRDVLDTLVADIKAQSPDHIAVTGDLINLALPGEFTQARAWLGDVGTPHNVTLVPGNHDAYVRPTQKQISEWEDYMRGDSAREGAPLSFPFLRRRGPLTLIGVSSSVPTGPFMATGWLGSSQLDALDRGLAQLESDPSFHVLLIHHPLSSKDSHKRLTDADALLALLKRRNVNLILHGHDHIHSTMWFEGQHGRIPAIGVPSASATPHRHYPPAAYNLFSITHDGSSWRCEHRVRGFADQAAIDRGEISELQRTQLI